MHNFKGLKPIPAQIGKVTSYTLYRSVPDLQRQPFLVLPIYLTCCLELNLSGIRNDMYSTQKAPV